MEPGSTRIKSVMIGERFSPVAAGGYGWKITFENGIWTYDPDEAWCGLKAALLFTSREVLPGCI